MQQIKLSITTLFLLFLIKTNAQVKPIAVLPRPQQFNFGTESFSPKYPYKITGVKNPDVDGLNLLKSILKIDQSAKKSLPISITILDKKGDKMLQRSGAYKMDISAAKINIQIFDDRSLFYAAQTLSQLTIRNTNGSVSLPLGSITDFPDVLFRGTVEGFYGEPWSHEDRLEQFRFYGKLKLNTYIYGPKDDPYHSSPNWRNPYPENKAQQIRALVGEARRNKVDFVWAIHPGKDIQWNKADSIAIVNKLEMMYQLGVRSFAVFFDDISGTGTNAEKQASLLNYIQHDFINKKKDVSPLIMCPTEYNKGWSNPKPGTYLDVLGANLDPAIHVMWTGNTVVSDITKEGLEWVNNRIKRPAYVWWNFPVSDYVRDHLLMGPAYGIDQQAAKDMSGFVSNPMDKAEASKVAIFGVSLYSWNMKAFDPKDSWESANRFIMPEASDVFRLFNSHNSDPGKNGHGYRRTESVEIRPVIDHFSNEFKNGKYDEVSAAKILDEFKRIVPVASEIRTKSKNRRLVEQLSPWLSQFELLGKAGVNGMIMLEKWERNDVDEAGRRYLAMDKILDSMKLLDKTFNQNPYQPGVKAGSLVLTPFVKDIFKVMGSKLSLKGNIQMPLSFRFEHAIENSVNFTNSEKLKNQPLLFDQNSIAYSPVLEVLNLNKGEYFGIRLSPNLILTQLQFNLESDDLLTWGAFEASADGKNWQKIVVTEKKGKGVYNKFNEQINYLRFRNLSDDTHAVYLRAYRLTVKPGADIMN